jgi:hypothetical protein
MILWPTSGPHDCPPRQQRHGTLASHPVFSLALPALRPRRFT